MTTASALFSLYLTPRRIGNAELTLGAINNTILNGSDLIWAPILKSTNKRDTWSLSPSSMVVNGHALKESLLSKQAMVFSSRTSNIVMSRTLATVSQHMYAP
jgi:Eukaryotic aspartyl protease